MQFPIRAALAAAASLSMLAGCGGADALREVPAAMQRKLQALAPATQSVLVCKGLSRENCDTVDTSVIGGLPLSQYVVTRPGAMLFDTARRRTELNVAPNASNMCAANPVFNTPAAPFTAAWSKVTVFETQLGGGYSRQSADMEFTGVRTPDGLELARFGFILNQERGNPIVALQFRPGVDANLEGVEGLDADVVLGVDMTTGAITEANFVALPAPLKNLLASVATHLPQLYAGATETERRPGNLLPLWSAADIQAMATKFSAASALVSQPVFAPVLTLTCNDSNCAEGASVNRFREYLVRYGADYLQSGRPEVAAGMLANLKSWAAAGALTSYPGFVVGQPGQNDFRPKYEMLYVLTPMIKTWSLLRADPQVSPSDRTLIDNWFEQLVQFATEPPGGAGAETDPFNAGYLSRAVGMAWGAVRGDHERFARGVERFYAGLHQMRADGSFPREVARGACSLRYQDTMILHMVTMAEIAATQGYDLYALEVDGKSLHTAIRFLLDAVEDPQVVLAYANQDPGNCNVGPAVLPLDLDGVTNAPLGFTYSAWLEPYRARFASHPNAARLPNLLAGGLAHHAPLFHPHAGGNTSCFAAGAKPELSARRLDCLFDWGQSMHAGPLPLPMSHSLAFGPYYAREFGGGFSYLGVSAQDDRLYYLSGQMLDLGPVSDWLTVSGCQASTR